MTNKFADLTAFLPEIKEDEFVAALYQFCEAHPEYEHTNYRSTLEKNGVQWGAKTMAEADVSNMDATGVIALLIGADRAERFCDGAFQEFIENGSIARWLERLAELGKE